MRLQPLPASEYEGRVRRLQGELARAGLDAFVGYSSESESGVSRYLTGFWPFFDFACVVVPTRGKTALVTGGPESFEFASKFARAPEVRVNPLLVESSPPEWVPEVQGESFATLLPSVCGGTPKHRMMREAFDNVYNTAFKYKTTLRLGAYIFALEKISKTLKLRGIYG